MVPPAPDRPPAVTLERLTPANLEAALRLQVAPTQTAFVAPNAISMAEAAVYPGVAWPRLILAGAEPVGFVMLERTASRCLIWRLMIDADAQGRGYGAATLARLSELATGWGYDRLDVTVVDEPGGPRGFYERAGFVATGEVEEGEVVLARGLTR